MSTTTTPYVYRYPVSPPTNDFMVPNTLMCGVLPTATGSLTGATACACDPPFIQYTKRVYFNYPWNDNLTDPATTDFVNAMVALEATVIYESYLSMHVNVCMSTATKCVFKKGKDMMKWLLERCISTNANSNTD